MFDCSQTHVIETKDETNENMCKLDGKDYFFYTYPCKKNKLYDCVGLDVLCRFDHPNLQKALHLYIQDGKCNVLLPMYTGTLGMLLGKFYGVRQKLKAVYPLFSALGLLHRNNISHGSIQYESCLYFNDTINLCDLSNCKYDDPSGYKKDIMALGGLLLYLYYENENMEVITETSENSDFYSLVTCMLDPEDTHTCDELTYFPVFDGIRYNIESNTMRNVNITPRTYDNQYREDIKAFVNQIRTLYPTTDVKHLFRTVTTAKRCGSVAIATPLLLKIIFYMSAAPESVVVYCKKVSIQYDDLKHYQLPVIQAVSGSLWYSQAADCCLSLEHYEICYFDIMLSKSENDILMLDPKQFKYYLGPGIALKSCTQDDLTV